MKTHSITKPISSMIIFVLIIAGAIESRAQQVITFTNGAELKAFITYQTKDSVRYYLDTKPDVVYVETMDHIQRITPLNPLIQKPDSLTYLQC
jgi:hypothetical protein